MSFFATLLSTFAVIVLVKASQWLFTRGWDAGWLARDSGFPRRTAQETLIMTHSGMTQDTKKSGM